MPSLTVQVADALVQDGKTDPADIVVVDVGGHIHLSGAVSTPGEADRATEIAESVQGFKAVTNNIIVA
jgi:osmotically-inducible protein OsmY